MDLDAAEFPVLDTLPRIFGPQAAPDALTQQLAPGAREIVTRPLLAEEYAAPGARAAHSRLWRAWWAVFAGALGAILLQAFSYLLITWVLEATTPIVIQGSTFYREPSPLEPWLVMLAGIPPALTLAVVAGTWRKSRALAAGLLLMVLLLAPLWTNYARVYTYTGFTSTLPVKAK
jgi:hypothetical protein